MPWVEVALVAFPDGRSMARVQWSTGVELLAVSSVVPQGNIAGKGLRLDCRNADIKPRAMLFSDSGGVIPKDLPRLGGTGGNDARIEFSNAVTVSFTCRPETTTQPLPDQQISIYLTTNFPTPPPFYFTLGPDQAKVRKRRGVMVPPKINGQDLTHETIPLSFDELLFGERRDRHWFSATPEFSNISRLKLSLHTGNEDWLLSWSTQEDLAPRHSEPPPRATAPELPDLQPRPKAQAVPAERQAPHEETRLSTLRAATNAMKRSNAPLAPDSRRTAQELVQELARLLGTPVEAAPRESLAVLEATNADLGEHIRELQEERRSLQRQLHDEKQQRLAAERRASARPPRAAAIAPTTTGHLTRLFDAIEEKFATDAPPGTERPPWLDQLATAAELLKDALPEGEARQTAEALFHKTTGAGSLDFKRAREVASMDLDGAIRDAQAVVRSYVPGSGTFTERAAQEECMALADQVALEEQLDNTPVRDAIDAALEAVDLEFVIPTPGKSYNVREQRIAERRPAVTSGSQRNAIISVHRPGFCVISSGRVTRKAQVVIAS